MKIIRFLAVSLLSTLAVSLCSCHNDDTLDQTNDVEGNFQALWEIIDRHYCFLDRDSLDWNAVYRKYSPMVSSRMGSYNMFRMLSEMLDYLQDGHVNLSSPYGTSYYRKWWSDYPQNFNDRVIEENYLRFNYTQIGPYTYAHLPTVNVGYVRVSSFGSEIGEGNLDWILSQLALVDGLIIDVRDNGGGLLTAAETLARRFITRRTLAGYISHKTGPGHNEFSDPEPFYYTPPSGHVIWGKPVVVLTNRSTFSAANTFVAFMRSLGGNVTVAGATTGGGSGMPFSSSLPCGWTLRFSACPVYDPSMLLTELGVSPTPGHEVQCTSEELGRGYDAILEHAVEFLIGAPIPTD